MGKEYISDWAKKINWEKRVKAVCKPCWEIKYCPYGPLVEQFPIKEKNDERTCKIFGHDCPVFYVAEPFTETKELRRITRSIPRTIQFKVLKRENQICSICGNPVPVERIEFDHIIPWSKGGPTEEYNIRLLCTNCNKKKGNRFEQEFLVSSGNDHYTQPHEIGIVDFVLMTVAFGHDFLSETNKYPEAKDFADRLNDGELTIAEQSAAQMYIDITDFFNHAKPKDLKVNEFEFLKFRWGYKDWDIHYLAESCKEFNISIEEGIDLDRYIMTLLGFRVKNDRITLKKWRKF
jgi:hypothetical protein